MDRKITEMIEQYAAATKKVVQAVNEQRKVKWEITEVVVKNGWIDCLEVNFSRLSRMTGSPNPRYMK
jgi:hypothetical protein